MALLALAGFKSWGQETILSENFNSLVSLPDGWTTTVNNGTGWFVGSSGQGAYSYETHSLFCNGSSSKKNDDLVTTPIALTNYQEASLSFMYSNRYWSGDSDGLKIYYSTSNTGDWTFLYECSIITYDEYTYNTVNVDLSSLCGSSIYLRFEHINNWGYGVALDDILITGVAAESCPKPKNLAVSNVTATGATISWTGSAESYDLAYGVASTFNLENPSTYTLQNTTTTSVQLSGLTAETEYKCAVRSRCDAESVSDWSDAISFLPTDKIIVDFESGIPSDWTLIDNDGDRRNWFIAQTDHHSGSNSLQSESYSETYYVPYNADNFFVSPQLLLGENASLSFYTRNYNGYGYKDRLRVQISTTGNDAGSFTTTLYDDKPSSDWTEIQIDLSEYEGESVYIAFRHTDYNMESIYIDDITIDLGETAEKYAITLTQPSKEIGTISADLEEATAGTTVTLSADFNLGYTLNYFMVDGVQIEGNTFEMPEHNVTVSVAYNTLDMYDITFDSEIDDDIISVSATYNGEPVTAAPAGTEITLSYSNLDEGYIFNNWTLDGVILPGNTFEMPERNVEIGVDLTERKRYAVTIDSDVQDYITANPSSDILDGTTVTLTISPATGYVLTELHVLDEGENEQAVTINPENSNIRTFIMPESNVTVSAVFSPVYNISIDMALVGGSISQMSTQGALSAYPAGTQVFLFANPDEDYSFVENSFIVIRSDGEIGPFVTYTNMMYSFIMPESNVTVSATFNKTAFAVSQVITPTYSGSFSVSKTAHVETGETVTLSNFNAGNGYYFDFEDVNSLVVKRNDNQETVEVNNYGNIYQFAMPTSDVTVTATFKDLPRYSVFVGDVVNGTITLDNPYQDIFAGAIVYFEVEPETGYTLESITVTPEEGNPFEPTQQYDFYYFTMPSSNVTISATFRQLQTYTINYYVNGELEKTLQCREDYPVNIDNPANIPAGVSFEGWGVASINTYLTEKPAIVGNYELPTQNYDLYAVFSYSEMGGATAWTKVTDFSELNDNDVVIIGAVQNGNSGYTMNEFSEMSSSATCPALPATFSNDGTTITELPEGTTHFTITKYPYNDGGIYLQGESGKNLSSFWTYNLNIPTGWEELVGDEYNDIITFDNGKLIISYNDYWDELYVILRNIDQYGGINMRFGVEQIQPGYYDAAYLYKQQGTLATYYMTSVLADGGVTENTTAKNIIITTGTVTVNNDIVLTMAENGLFRNEDAADFVFKDGAQLIYNGAEKVNATFEKNIAEANTRDSEWSGWYTISSPLAESVNVTDVTNLIPTTVTATDYDLYRLNEADFRWENARPETNQEPAFTTIDKGVGYIYSNNAGADYIAFAGEINVEDVECTLTKDAGYGFNLIGNPFMQNIELANVTDVTLAEGFYVLNNDNTWGTEPMTGEIKPLQGFLVQATEEGGTARISKNASVRGERSNEQNTNIEVIVSNSNYRDNAYAMFGEGIGLNKISHRNAEAPMVYIPQDGENFAIAFMNENTTLFPLNFKAMTTGKYSISLKATDDINTLVLVDNMTGVETNMLLESSYSFIGSPADRENRFTVKLGISQNNGQNDNEHFVYQYGNELVINGEGTLQIFDVLGRVVISEEVHGQRVNIGNLVKGTYIVRMTGENVMTQKIIVK